MASPSSPPALGVHVGTHRTKAEMAYEALRNSVLEGRIPAGRRLTTAELCQTLSMSATPVREAIRRLQAEGLVVNEPHCGITVRDLESLPVDDFFVMRAPMESLATKHAVPRLTGDDIAALAAIQGDLERAAREGDDECLTSANVRWHMGIYAACPTRPVVQLIQQLWMPFHWSSVAYWHDDVLRDATVRDHAAIMAAIAQRDAELAASLMHEHIVRVHEEVSRREALRRAADDNGANGSG